MISICCPGQLFPFVVLLGGVLAWYGSSYTTMLFPSLPSRNCTGHKLSAFPYRAFWSPSDIMRNYPHLLIVGTGFAFGFLVVRLLLLIQLTYNLKNWNQLSNCSIEKFASTFSGTWHSLFYVVASATDDDTLWSLNYWYASFLYVHGDTKPIYAFLALGLWQIKLVGSRKGKSNFKGEAFH